MDSGGRVGFGARFEADIFSGGPVTGSGGAVSGAAVGIGDRCFEGFAGGGGVDLSAVDGDFFVERATDSGRGDVPAAGRFLFSGMRFKIITSLAASNQLDRSASFTAALKTHAGFTAKTREPRNRRRYQRQENRLAPVPQPDKRLRVGRKALSRVRAGRAAAADRTFSFAPSLLRIFDVTVGPFQLAVGKVPAGERDGESCRISTLRQLPRYDLLT
jgi:hypothetical protein